MRSVVKLILYSFALWVFFAWVGPFLVSLSPDWQRYNAVSEEKGLNSGHLYYTDVPIIQEAEQVNRDAVRRAYAKDRSSERPAVQ